jgi:hypothetical protein
MTTGAKIQALRERSWEEESQGHFEVAITLSNEMLGLLGNSRTDLKLAALQLERVARMHLRLNQPIEAESAARKSLDVYLRNRERLEGKWNPEGDTYLADFRMMLALSLAYQKRYAEAMPYAEQWERVHLKVRGADDPFVKEVVVRHMKRMRARLAGLPVPENDQDDHVSIKG